jgi:hypothetical protein
MSAWLKCVVSLAVVFGILYVLISPLPEVAATFSGKSALNSFVLVTHALLDLFFFALFASLRPSGPGFAPFLDLLSKICVRLC